MSRRQRRGEKMGGKKCWRVKQEIDRHETALWWASMCEWESGRESERESDGERETVSIDQISAVRPAVLLDTVSLHSIALSLRPAQSRSAGHPGFGPWFSAGVRAHQRAHTHTPHKTTKVGRAHFDCFKPMNPNQRHLQPSFSSEDFPTNEVSEELMLLVEEKKQKG